MIGTRCSAGVGNDHKLQSGGMITVLIHQLKFAEILWLR